MGTALLAAGLVATLPVASSAQSAPAATADDAAKLAEAHAILAIMFPPDKREQMFGAIMNQVVAQIDRIVPTKEVDTGDAGADAIMAKFKADTVDAATQLIKAHMPDIIEANAQAYAHQFSLDELKQIHAFAETPAGSHYMSRAASLVNDPAYVAATSALGDETRRVLQERAVKLRADLTAYFQAHPEAAKRVVTSAKQGK
jgi:hypothetical protein